MAFSSFMPTNSTQFAKRMPFSPFDHNDSSSNAFNGNSIRSSLSCNFGSDLKYATDGFGSNSYSNENATYMSNSSKLDCISEFYSPWSHRTFLNSCQLPANGNSSTNKPNASHLMSPNGVNLDALVSKLIADDDDASDLMKAGSNPNRYFDEPNPLMNRDGLADQLSCWAIKDVPNYGKPQVKQDGDTNKHLFAQSKPRVESSFNYAGGDYVPLNNNVCHFNNAQFWKADKQNFRADSEFNNYTPTSAHQYFDHSANIQKNVAQRELLNQQFAQSRQQFVNNHAQPQIRSIRAAVRNSSIAGKAPQNDLHYQVERCIEQFKLLESERKKVEQEMSAKFVGKKVSSANNLPVPRLPLNSSRIDRLIVDQYKEHARVITLVAYLERLNGNQEVHEMVHESIRKWYETIRQLHLQRKGDLLPACRPRLNNVPEDVNDYICSQTSLVVHELCVKTRSVRTALWCAAISISET